MLSRMFRRMIRDLKVKNFRVLVSKVGDNGPDFGFKMRKKREKFMVGCRL